MKFTHGICLVAVLGGIFLGVAGGYAQTTKPTSITISPQNPILNVGQTQQFTAQSGNTLDLGESGAIAAGYYHTCAVLSDGTAKCWGENNGGQLGDGTKTRSASPVTVKNLNGVVTIAVGEYHTCALLANGTVKCWGYNHSGQLGDGTKTDSLTPVAVLAGAGSNTVLSDVSAIAAGGRHTCALLANATVKCWGKNEFGQLGDGSKTESTTPIAVKNLNAVAAIAVGDGHTCALLSYGTAMCWGSNYNGQLGDGSKLDSTTPVAVSGLSGAVAISTGLNHTCAVLSDGTAKCWGRGYQGQLGDGTKRLESLTPVTVLADPNSGAALTGVVAIAAEGDNTCALLASGTAKCWGDNSRGQLGDGTRYDSLAPVAVSGLSGGVAISGSHSHTCALLPMEMLCP